MADREVKLKLGWLNIFNLGGALLGWMHGHTWEDSAVGFLVGSAAPFVVIFGILVVALVVVKGGELIADAIPTRARIAQAFREETQDERWNREYAEHCKAAGVPNELQTNYRVAASAPIRQEPEADFIVERPDYNSYTSSSGPG